MKIAITGHRPNKLGNDYDLTSPLINKIKQSIIGVLLEECDDLPNLTLISGMALGIDTLFAKLAIEFRYPLIAAIPCLEQDKMWQLTSKMLYQQILKHPNTTSVYITKEVYHPSSMQIRNKWMVDNCDVLIAVWDGTSGGTANCVAYAESVGRKVIRINPNLI